METFSPTVVQTALGEPRCDFSQVALSDGFTVKYIERLRSGCAGIHGERGFVVLGRTGKLRWACGRQTKHAEVPNTRPRAHPASVQQAAGRKPVYRADSFKATYLREPDRVSLHVRHQLQSLPQVTHVKALGPTGQLP
jgi:hypothetical protein